MPSNAQGATPDEIWRQSKTAVGEDDPNSDWILEPEKHAAALPAESGPLKRVLQRRAITGIMKRYREADRRAGECQKAYKTNGSRAIVLGTIAVVAGGFALYFDERSWIFASAGHYSFLTLQVLAIAAAAYFAFLWSRGEPYKKWMEQRSLAESARIALFDTVCGVEDEHSGADEIDLGPLQLEYFRRYQLDVQLRYYEGRADELEATSRKFLKSGAGVAAFSALATAAATAFGGIAVLSALAALALLAVPAIAGALGSLQLLHEGKRNAIRYRNTHSHLEAIAGELDTVRCKVAAGDRPALLAFVGAVNDQISVEHREWRTLQDKAEQPHVGLPGDDVGNAPGSR
jgi:hypothetical protein